MKNLSKTHLTSAITIARKRAGPSGLRPSAGVAGVRRNKNRETMKKLYLLLILFITACSSTPETDNVVAKENIATVDISCDQQWQDFYAKYINKELSINQLIDNWYSKKDECSGSGSYELILANLFSSVGDYKKAAKVAYEGTRLETPRKFELYLILLDNSYFFPTEESKTLDIDKWKEILTKYLELENVSDKSAALISRIGDLYYRSGEYEKANEFAKKSINSEYRKKINPNDYLVVLRSAAMLKKHEECVDYYNMAKDLNPNVERKLDVLLFVSRSAAKLGSKEIAKDLLAKAAVMLPDVRVDPYYVETQRLILNK